MADISSQRSSIDSIVADKQRWTMVFVERENDVPVLRGKGTVSHSMGRGALCRLVTRQVVKDVIP